MAVRSLAAAFLAAWLSVAPASAQEAAAPAPPAAPLAPVFTNFSYYDHHWIQWLPDHPVYEAIEAQVYEGPGAQRFVRVFLTERAPPKRQTYYFSDADTAARWSSGRAFAREISLDSSPNAGGARNLALRLTDAEGAALEWLVEFDATDVLNSSGAGSRPSQGHAGDTAYIFHYYGNSAVARRARLTIAGQVYQYDRREGDAVRRGPKTGYTAGSYTPVIRLGEFACEAADAGLSCSQGRLFERTDENELRTGRFGYAGLNQITLTLDAEANVTSYTHAFGEHAFRFEFEPALPSADSLRGGERFGYAVSLDGARVVTGAITAVRENGGVALRWTPENPSWMSAHPMTTMLASDRGGYRLTLRAGSS